MAGPAKTLRDGRYAVMRVLGEGSQASTLEAVDKKNGVLVAVKRFRVRGASSWKEVELAEREARVLASIDHPMLPRYVEHFEEEGELYLVTEKIEGESLLALRKRGAGSNEAEVIRLLRDASSTLDYLHGRSPPIIHRDIKPSNVLRRPDGSFALIDFGAVRDRMKPEGGSTVVGTFGYMAPEQFQGRAMPASDVYAIGATAISMLTGREPEELPHRGLAIDVSAALRGTNASPAMVRALTAMLEPDPDKRASRLAPLIASSFGEPSPSQPRRKEPRRSDSWRAEGWESSRRSWKEQRKHSNKEERRREREEKRRAKEEKRQARERNREPWGGEHVHPHDVWRDVKQRRHTWDGQRPPIPMPILILLLVGLTFAQIVLTLVLRGALPVLFAIMSIVFGQGMREAATKVRLAGKEAVHALSRAKKVLRGIPVEEPGARVRVPEDGPRVRVEPWENEEHGAAEEQAAYEERAAREADEAERKRGRRL